MRFETKEQLLDALNMHHVTNHCTYKTTHSNTTRLGVQCAQQVCPWKCQTILRARNQVWEIRKVEGVHTFATQLITHDHKHLGSRTISQHVRQMVELDLSTPIATIISSIHTSMGITQPKERHDWRNNKKLKMCTEIGNNRITDCHAYYKSCKLICLGLYTLKISPITHGEEVLENQKNFQRVL